MKFFFKFGAILLIFSSLLLSPSFGIANGPLTEKAPVIEEVAKDGAKVIITAQSIEYSQYELNGTGFKPYEPLHFVSTSYIEVLSARVRASEKGNIGPMGYIPAVIGKSGGIWHLDIVREKDSFQVNIPWGTERSP